MAGWVVEVVVGSTSHWGHQSTRTLVNLAWWIAVQLVNERKVKIEADYLPPYHRQLLLVLHCDEAFAKVGGKERQEVEQDSAEMDGQLVWPPDDCHQLDKVDEVRIWMFDQIAAVGTGGGIAGGGGGAAAAAVAVAVAAAAAVVVAVAVAVAAGSTAGASTAGAVAAGSSHGLCNIAVDAAAAESVPEENVGIFAVVVEQEDC